MSQDVITSSRRKWLAPSNASAPRSRLVSTGPPWQINCCAPLRNHHKLEGKGCVARAAASTRACPALFCYGICISIWRVFPHSPSPKATPSLPINPKRDSSNPVLSRLSFFAKLCFRRGNKSRSVLVRRYTGRNGSARKITLSKLQFSDDNFCLATVTKNNCNGDKKTVKATRNEYCFN